MRFKKFSKFKRKGNFSKPKRSNYEPAYNSFRDDAKRNTSVAADDKLDHGISNIALRDMPKSTYAIKESPYDELNEAGTPYPFTAQYNSNVSASYAGYENLDGGKTAQYLSSNKSRLLHTFDTMNLQVGVNYRFLNIDNKKETISSRGTRILRLMYDAAVEALAQLDATTFMELELNKTYVVGTPVKIDGVEPFQTVAYSNNGETEVIYFYNDTAAVIVLASIEYQITLQQTIANFNSYNKFMSYNKKMLQMNYMREVPILNDLFGQLKKVGFVTKLDSLSLALQGEWIDVDWAQQNNITANQVSRKSDGMIDPVLELSTTYNVFRDIFIFSDTAELKTGLSALHEYDPEDAEPYVYTDRETLVAATEGIDTLTLIWDQRSRVVTLREESGQGGTFSTPTYEELSKRINEAFSIRATLEWARKIDNYGPLNISTSASSRFNHITWMIDCVNTVISRLKRQFGDLRTVFEKLSPLGIINYNKGVKLLRTAIYDAEFKHYITIDDIYKTILTGVKTITFNTDLGRWQSVALWDKVYGIPLFDAKNGGSFLTFCSKNLGPVGVEDESTSNVNLLPIIFTYGVGSNDDGVLATNRVGDTIKIEPKTVLANGEVTKRLAILPSQDAYTMNFPQVTDFNGEGNLVHMTTEDKSYARLACMNAFNCYKDTSGNNEISTDIIAFYEYQLVDIAQPMLSYAKAYGPIKGTSEKPGYIGFAGLSGTAKKA